MKIDRRNPAFAFRLGFLLIPCVVSSSLATASTIGCLIAPSRIADVGTPVAGVIEHMNVERGDMVKRGQVLVTLRADAERAQLASAQLRADAEATVAAAKTHLRLAQQKLDRAEDLHRQGFISAQALDQSRSERAVAAQTLQQALDQRAVLRADAEHARAMLRLRALPSPFDGVVVERLASPGERVELQPVLRLADLKELRVEAALPAAQFGSVREGQVASVTPDVPGMAARPAVVAQVDRIIDASSNTFRVRLALRNLDGGVPAGARCKLAFGASPAH